MIVFGKNYKYANAKATGDSFRFAATNLLAVTRNNSAGMLDDALYNVAWQNSLLADKQAKAKSGYVGTLVDIFA
jgi:hypothetical protein